MCFKIYGFETVKYHVSAIIYKIFVSVSFSQKKKEILIRISHVYLQIKTEKKYFTKKLYVITKRTKN